MNARNFLLTKAMNKGGSTPNAVQFIEQTLTEEQQMQARKNQGLYYKDTKTVFLVQEQEVFLVYNPDYGTSFGICNANDSEISNLVELPEFVLAVVDGIEHRLIHRKNDQYGNLFLDGIGPDTGEDFFVDLDGPVIFRGEKAACSLSVSASVNVPHEIQFEFVPAGVKRKINFLAIGLTTFREAFEYKMDDVVMVDGIGECVLLANGTHSYANDTGKASSDFLAMCYGRNVRITIHYDGENEDSVVTEVNLEELYFPSVTAADNGKIMAVVDGKWQLISYSELI